MNRTDNTAKHERKMQLRKMAKRAIRKAGMKCNLKKRKQIAGTLEKAGVLLATKQTKTEKKELEKLASFVPKHPRRYDENDAEYKKRLQEILKNASR